MVGRICRLKQPNAFFTEALYVVVFLDKKKTETKTDISFESSIVIWKTGYVIVWLEIATWGDNKWLTHVKSTFGCLSLGWGNLFVNGNGRFGKPLWKQLFRLVLLMLQIFHTEPLNTSEDWRLVADWLLVVEVENHFKEIIFYHEPLNWWMFLHCILLTLTFIF